MACVSLAGGRGRGRVRILIGALLFVPKTAVAIAGCPLVGFYFTLLYYVLFTRAWTGREREREEAWAYWGWEFGKIRGSG
jgi:hypothetical protein